MHAYTFVRGNTKWTGEEGSGGVQGKAVSISSSRGKDQEVPHWWATGTPVLKLGLPTILLYWTPTLRSSHPPRQERLGESLQRNARLLNKINYVHMKKHVQRFPKKVKGTGIHGQNARSLESLSVKLLSSNITCKLKKMWERRKTTSDHRHFLTRHKEICPSQNKELAFQPAWATDAVTAESARLAFLTTCCESSLFPF